MLKKIFLIALLLTILPLPSQAAEEAAAEMIALEIRNLSTSVDRLTRLLYDQGQTKEQDALLRKLDIAVAYLNFRSRRIEMLERDAQRSRSTLNRFEDILRQLEQRAEDLDDGTTLDPEQQKINEQEREGLASQTNMLKQRIDRLNNEILVYENRIGSLQDQLDSVESFVEKHLEL